MDRAPPYEQNGRYVAVVVVADCGHVHVEIVRDALLCHYVDEMINVSSFREVRIAKNRPPRRAGKSA
jgi:hypothetical protein